MLRARASSLCGLAALCGCMWQAFLWAANNRGGVKGQAIRQDTMQGESGVNIYPSLEVDGGDIERLEPLISKQNGEYSIELLRHGRLSLTGVKELIDQPGFRLWGVASPPGKEVWPDFTVTYNVGVKLTAIGSPPGAKPPVPKLPATAKPPVLKTTTRLMLRLVRVAYLPGGQAEDRAPAPPFSPAHVSGIIESKDRHQLLTGSRLAVTRADTGQPATEIVSLKHGRYDINLPGDGSYILTVTAPGHTSRSLMLTRYQTFNTLFDETGASAPLDRIEMSTETKGGGLTAIDPTRRGLFDLATTTSLPLPGIRDPDYLALLAPGVAPAPEAFGRAGPSLSPGLGTAGQFAINGIRPRENNFTVDGSDNNDEEVGVRRQGFVALFPLSIESVSEFQALTALPDARFGRAMGGQMNALSRYGTSGFHGNVYGFGAGGGLVARNFFDLRAGGFPAGYQSAIPITTDGTLRGPGVRFQLDPGYRGPVKVTPEGFGYQDNPAGGKDTYSRMQSGFTFGGPLHKRDTFFFVALERDVINARQESHFSVPTMQQRGFFNSGATGGQVTFAVLSGPAGIKFVTQPVSPASAPGNRIFSLIPFPNNPLGPYGQNTFTQQLGADARNTTYTAKLDRNLRFLRMSHAASARYTNSTENSQLPSVGGAIFSAVRPRLRTANVAGFFDTRITAGISNIFRASFGRTSAHFDELRDPFLHNSDFVSGHGFLLNAPLLLNATQTAFGDFPFRPPIYVSRNSATARALLGAPALDAESRTEFETGPLGQLRIAGFSPLGLDVYHFPQNRFYHTIQLADTVTTSFGRHLLLGGLDTRDLSLNSYQDRNARPLAEFHGLVSLICCGHYVPVATPDYPGDDRTFDSALTLAAAGIPTGLYQTIAATPESSRSPLILKRRQIDLFAQDYYRVASRLQVSGGLRVELSRLPDDSTGRIAKTFGKISEVESPQIINEAANQCDEIVAPPEVVGYVKSTCRGIAGNIQSLFSPGVASVFDASPHMLSGRAGFAWDPLGNGKMAVRGGWGLYNSQFPAIIVNESRSSFPDFLPLNFANFNYLRPSLLYSPANTAEVDIGNYLRGARPVVQPGTLNTLNLYPDDSIVSIIARAVALGVPVHPAANLKNSYATQSALTLELELTPVDVLSLGYVNTLGRRLLRVNTPLRGPGRIAVNFAGTAAAFDFFPSPYGNIDPGWLARGPLPYAAPTLYETSASSSYNGFQAEYRHRLRGGLLLGTAFTWSHAIDDASDFWDTASGFALPQNSVKRDEKGDSAFDARLRLATHFVWEPPFHNRLLRHWQVSGTLIQQTGQPYTVNTTVDVNQDGNATDRLNTTAGLIFNPRADDRRVLISRPATVAVRSLLAPARFLGTQGSPADGAVGRNTFRGPGVNDANIALSRTIGIRERFRVILRGEAFNVLNHAQFGIPVRILEAPAFGSSVSTINPGRTIQFALKLAF